MKKHTKLCRILSYHFISHHTRRFYHTALCCDAFCYMLHEIMLLPVQYVLLVCSLFLFSFCTSLDCTALGCIMLYANKSYQMLLRYTTLYQVPLKHSTPANIRHNILDIPYSDTWHYVVLYKITSPCMSPLIMLWHIGLHGKDPEGHLSLHCSTLAYKRT